MYLNEWLRLDLISHHKSGSHLSKTLYIYIYIYIYIYMRVYTHTHTYTYLNSSGFSSVHIGSKSKILGSLISTWVGMDRIRLFCHP